MTDAPQQESGLPSNLAAAIQADLSQVEASESNSEAQQDSGEPTDAEIVAGLRGEAPPKAPVQEEPSADEAQLEKWIAQRKRLNQERRKVKAEADQNRQAIEAARQFQELQELAKKDPLAAQQRLNLNPEDLIRRMIEEGEKIRPLSVEERLAKIEAQRVADAEEFQRQQQEASESRHKAELDHYTGQYMNGASELAQSNVERYELINTYGQLNRVWKKAVSIFKERGKLPTPEVAMDMVENDLRSDIKKLVSTGYFKTLVQEYQGTKKPPSSVSYQSKPASITNSSTRSGSALSKSLEDETDEEAEQRALEVFLQSVKR